MVNIKDIINKLLKDSGKITPDEAVEIQKIANEYPFFQQAFLFQTLFLKQSGSFYKATLQQTAARTTDRQRLYEIIELGKMHQTPQKDITIKTTENETSVELATGNYTKKNKGAEPTKNDKKRKKSQEAKSEIEKKKKTAEKISEKNLELAAKLTKNEEISTGISSDLKKEKKLSSKTALQSSKKTKKETKKKKKEIKEEKNTRKLSYLEWLKQVNTVKKQENKEIFDAIDKFLQERPKIVPKRENAAETPAIIEKSIEEKQSLMTETLADLYVKQKKYDKAIQAFKILSLKYPKKSSYFANRIKELKQKLK